MVKCSLTQTHSNIWAWRATSRSIWMPRLSQHFAHSRQARSESKSLFRNITFLTGYTMRTYGFSRHTPFRLVCMWVRFGPLWSVVSKDPYLQQGKEMDSPLHKWLFSVLKRSWCVMQECGLEPLQFNWFRAAMRLYNSLTKSNSYTMKKVLHVDMQLSTSSDRRQNCEPIDLSRFVVDLRERDLEYRTSYSETHPREHNSKRSTYHQWCALPTKRALVTH